MFVANMTYCQPEAPMRGKRAYPKLHRYLQSRRLTASRRAVRAIQSLRRACYNLRNDA